MTDFREYENGQHVNLSCAAPRRLGIWMSRSTAWSRKT